MNKLQTYILEICAFFLLVSLAITLLTAVSYFFYFKDEVLPFLLVSILLSGTGVAALLWYQKFRTHFWEVAGFVVIECICNFWWFFFW